MQNRRHFLSKALAGASLAAAGATLSRLLEAQEQRDVSEPKAVKRTTSTRRGNGVMNFEKRFDVLVCGGGIAGIAAALEVARSGLKTALVEKTILPGGLATSGLVNAYLPLCDGKGTQVTYGIAEELLHLSIKYGPGKIPSGWRLKRNAKKGPRYSVVFSPASFVLALDEAGDVSGLGK